MRLRIERTPGQGVDIKFDSGRTDGGYQWGLPARVYRKMAREVIEGLLAENRALRHGRLQPTLPQPSLMLYLRSTVLQRLAPKDEED